MYKLRRKLFSQNFLHNRKLISKLVRSSSIGKNDLVLEIGPGKGIITEQLLQQSQHVLAVEIDSHWFKYLQDKFTHAQNLTLYQEDILNFRLPALPYKVFANIPFSIEGKIIRKLIDSPNPPEDCYLVMMKELAYRLAAPHKENQFSISHKPWFDFSIQHRFTRKDFTPYANVDAAMIRFKKRKEPLLPWNEKGRYELFIEECFKYGMPIYHTLKIKYGKNKLHRVLNSIGENKDTKPSYLNLEQWIGLYKELALEDKGG